MSCLIQYVSGATRRLESFGHPTYKRDWNSAVYDHVEALNAQFKVPLPVSEVKAIAKSIANWGIVMVE
ncbi:primase C-terminal domain-containing protein, partial [Vibrio crassostreae]|uniref:primase C-terminal domain-containing protein n=1 Tax=Vibrio crassostreae TaxID=246167 RepID=UPI001F0F7008